MKHHGTRIGLAWLSAAVLCAAAGAEITRTPYIQDVRPTSAVVMWESDQPSPAVVHYGLDSKMPSTVNAAAVEMKPSVKERLLLDEKIYPPKTAHVFEALLQDLPTSATIYYQVEQAAVRSQPAHFHTAPRADVPFRFVAYGDTRTHPEIHAAIAQQILRAKPNLIIHTGDLVSSGREYARWTPEFFRPLEKVIDHIPLWPCIGNHENDGANLLNLFHLPGTELAYSFDYGSAHFAALDSILSSPRAAAEWLDRDLTAASQARWKFVLYHKPTFNAGGYHSAWGRTVLPPVLEKHRVDIVFSGHSHLYERMRPIAAGKDPRDWPVLYVVTGGGGASLTKAAKAPFVAASAREHHFVVLDVAGDRLSAIAVDEAGKEIDRFVIDKSNGHTPEFLAQAIPRGLIPILPDSDME